MRCCERWHRVLLQSPRLVAAVTELGRLSYPVITKRPLVFCVAAVALIGRASAVEFSNAVIAGKRVTVFRVNIQKERLQLFLHDDGGRPFKSFDAIDRSLQSHGQKLIFGMNAGMYHRDLSPVGLFVSGGQQLTPLNTSNGAGNFYLKPNGVFLVSERGARVVESSEYIQVSASESYLPRNPGRCSCGEEEFIRHSTLTLNPASFAMGSASLRLI